MNYFFSVLRSILATPIVVISVIIYGIIAAVTCTAFKGQKKYPTFFTTSWCRFVLWVKGIHVTVSGFENIPPTSCLYVFNHSSHLDIPILNSQLTNDIRFGAKDSLFKIPIFGQAVASFQTIKIVRGDREKVIKEYSQSLTRVKEQGISIILAAEGTRNKNPETFMPFKSGPFILAIEGQLPIVPVIIEGASQILPKHTYFMNFGSWRKQARLKILKPVSTAGLGLSLIHI